MRDLVHNIAVVQAMAPQAVAADKTGDAIDLKGFNGAMVVLSVGTVTDGVYAFELQESSDGTNFTAVDDKDLIGTERTGIATGAGNGGSAIHVLGYKGNKRYIRYKITETSAGTTGMVAEVLVIKGRPWSRPVG